MNAEDATIKQIEWANQFLCHSGIAEKMKDLWWKEDAKHFYGAYEECMKDAIVMFASIMSYSGIKSVEQKYD